MLSRSGGAIVILTFNTLIPEMLLTAFVKLSFL
jgi:hypothetical protein